jgi:hypothetical protein
MQIHFHTFRHWKATTEQHKTKDPWHVKMILGHKSIKSTETYIHLEKMLYEGEANDQFIVKVANTLEEAIKLMEVGFDTTLKLKAISCSERGNETTNYSKNYGIISQPLYFMNSKSCWLTLPLLMSCLILGSCASMVLTSALTVLQTVAYASLFQRLVMFA